MAFTLETSGTGASGSFGSPLTITLPNAYSTAAGDCLILALATSGTPTVGVSGCGATWVVTQIKAAGSQDHTLAIGYGCTAGGTSVSVTGLSGLLGSWIIASFSGVLSASSPIRSSVLQNSAATVTTLASSSMSYVVGDLLIGAGAENGVVGWTASTWSNGGTNHNIGSTAVQVGCILDYEVPASGSSTTYTINPASAQTLCASIVALKAAPVASGGMFAVL